MDQPPLLFYLFLTEYKKILKIDPFQQVQVTFKGHRHQFHDHWGRQFTHHPHSDVEPRTYVALAYVVDNRLGLVWGLDKWFIHS
jgi:hypothetical protein